jgi:ADP-heptose:LPS heptosyltransferase
MQRYGGEALPAGAHIVILGSCKVGNFVVSTPVLSGLKQRFPSAVIGFIGSEVTADFERAHPLIDWRCSWDRSGADALSDFVGELADRRRRHGDFTLAINLDGFNPVTTSLVSWLSPCWIAGAALSANRRRQMPFGDLPQQRFLADSDWDSKAFAQRYGDIFRSNYIAELFAQLAFVADHCDPTQITLPSVPPDFDVPDVLIHATTARSAKIWPFDRWLSVIQFIQEAGLSVGLVGSSPRIQQDAYNSGCGEEWLLHCTSLLDLRGRTSLLQLAGACAQARAVLTVDAGPLHIAAAMGTPTLAIVGNDANAVGASPLRLWLPRCANVNHTVSEHSCGLCAENRFRNDDCLAPSHFCMHGVTSEQVTRWLQSTLSL